MILIEYLRKYAAYLGCCIVESVQFLNEDTFDDEVDSDDDCDNDCDIEDLHTAKPLGKGLKYFTSGHVQKCKTVLRVDIIF